jgi:hypothetical protein
MQKQASGQRDLTHPWKPGNPTPFFLLYKPDEKVN